MRKSPSQLSWSVLLMALVLGLAVLPGAGSAVVYPPQCGGDHIVSPRPPRNGQRPPLAIGDSTMLLAAYDLAGAGFQVDAQGCRQYGEALQILRRRRDAGTLPHMVVIALGADGVVTHSDIGRALGLMCCTRLLVLVTNRELGGGSGSDAVTTREEVARHHGRARLLDWVRYSAGHGNWFQPDGLHLTSAGAEAFSRFLTRAMAWAYPRRVPEATLTPAG